MDLKTSPVTVSDSLLEAIRSFPREREVEHCGSRMAVSPFDFYATCPRCGVRIKLRSYAATAEIEDVFDAVFEWLNHPGAAEVMKRRQAAIAEDSE